MPAISVNRRTPQQTCVRTTNHLHISDCINCNEWISLIHSLCHLILNHNDIQDEIKSRLTVGTGKIYLPT